jgi:DNA-binding response OmpR family regulator
MNETILYVEDNPDDALLVEMAFRRAGVTVQLQIAVDGAQAIDGLQQDKLAVLPVFVLLDIKLPDLSGLEVLAWIRSQAHLKRVPVVMFTSSTLADDINAAYDLGANSYLVKPPDLDSLVALAKTIDRYWLHANVKGSVL